MRRFLIVAAALMVQVVIGLSLYHGFVAYSHFMLRALKLS